VPWQPLTGACSRSTAQWTAGIATVGNCPNDDTTAQLPGLTFTSEAFTKPYDVSGPIAADLWISSTRPDTTLTVTVGDVQPDGTVARVTAGSLVGSLAPLVTKRCGAKVMDCSVYAGNVPVVPWHAYTRASQTALTGAPTEVMVEVFPTAVTLEPGHRLRIAVTTADLPHQGPNASTLANSVGGVTTVYFDAQHPSRVYLGANTGSKPVPGGKAQPAASASAGGNGSAGATVAPAGTSATAGTGRVSVPNAGLASGRAVAAELPAAPLAVGLPSLGVGFGVFALAAARRRRRLRA
jgi:hypothetical protein